AGDQLGQSNCYGECSAVWQPYVPYGPVVAGRRLPGTLSVIERNDGTPQVSFNGQPLYYFAGDYQPGDENGAGAASFGAPWMIATISVAPGASAPPAQAVPVFSPDQGVQTLTL